MFYAAQSGAALADALMVAAVDRVFYAVHDATGKVVLTGEADGMAYELPAGDYKVVVKAGSRDIVVPRATVGVGQATALTIKMKDGQLIVD